MKGVFRYFVGMADSTCGTQGTPAFLSSALADVIEEHRSHFLGAGLPFLRFGQQHRVRAAK